jgi:hypothetical protein
VYNIMQNHPDWVIGTVAIVAIGFGIAFYKIAMKGLGR